MSESGALLWIMIMRGSNQWNYIPAEEPCWKGEINLSFWLFCVAIGWQRKPTPQTQPEALPSPAGGNAKKGNG